MKQKRLFIAFVILTLAFASLACGLFSGGKETSTAEPPAQSKPEDDVTDIQPDAEKPVDQFPADDAENSAPPPSIDLGDEYRSEDGGYAFRQIPEYEVEEIFGLTSMVAPNADPDLGPLMMLIGGTNEEPTTEEEIFNNFMQDVESEDIQVLDQREITVNGHPGILADIGGDVDGHQVVGRIVVVSVSPTQQFTMFASAPEIQWNQVEPFFDAVLASVYFFEPAETDFLEELDELVPEEIPLEEGELIRQWGKWAEASSEYGTDYWSAQQATGEPDTPICGDQVTAWASLSSSGVDWIEITYETPVIPTEINILQTDNPDQVVQVEIIDQNGGYTTIYEAEPVDWASGLCPYILTIPVEDFSEPTASIRIHVDQSEWGLWNEIDAVELVGNTYLGDFSSTPEIEINPAGSDFPSTANELPPGGFAFLIAPPQGLPTFVTEGILQDQSTNAEYVIGLVSEDQKYSLTIFLPLDVATGFYPMTPYDDSSHSQSPGGAIYTDLTLYTNTDGIIMIEEMANNKITGTIVFTAIDQDGNEITVSGFFNQLPIGSE